jgi:hypothetical protein
VVDLQCAFPLLSLSSNLEGSFVLYVSITAFQATTFCPITTASQLNKPVAFLHDIRNRKPATVTEILCGFYQPYKKILA